MFKKVVLLLILLLFVCRPAWASGVILSAEKVDYALPYPGMLPDSPFYILKVARDNVVALFLRSPKDRAFYFLLQADKRLAAGQALIGQNKIHLGATTIAQGEEYFGKAVTEALKIRDPDLLAKLVMAGAKHEEVVGELRAKTTGDDYTLLEKLRVDAQKQSNRVMEVFVQK
jgi:hypothetical protein